MRKKDSILHELSNYVPAKSKKDVVEMRAQHVISSAIYLFEMIDQEFSPEEADQLKKRFVSSIKGNDPQRFSRSIRKVVESHNK